jgi:AraC family transcriptional regulator
VKRETRNFYEQIVHAAATRVVSGLDHALDLAVLAKKAALSPLHFHRIFRGMLGETPLELHRRLRLERAALQLAVEERPVTRVAFDAGYDTHESFTRAFRAAYSIAPSDFRTRVRAVHGGCAARVPYRIAAHSGLHYQAELAGDLCFQFVREESDMNVEIETKPAQRVAALTHIGPYNMIGETFGRMGKSVAEAGLLGPDVQMVAIYHEDPEANASSELRSEAGIVVPEGAALPPELHEVVLPAGRYARTTHVGPYQGLGDAWANFMGRWLPDSGHKVADGVCYELYRKMDHERPDELETDLYVSIA